MPPTNIPTTDISNSGTTATDPDPRKAVHSDMPAQSWVDRGPGFMRPYLRLARLDRPIGIWLLLFPCWWGVALAADGFPSPHLLVLFALGAVLMRSAGCVINDMADRDIDAKVTRTRRRPLASGELSPLQAGVFLAALLVAALWVLVQFNPLTVALGVGSLALVFVYPFLKRLTYWPQLGLGLAFNWGALMGWTAAREEMALPALLLYGAGICWTLGYDTIYAHQDRADDMLAGVKSLALRLGTRTRAWLWGFYGGSLLLLAAAAEGAGLSSVFYGGLAIALGHLVWQISRFRLDDPQRCLHLFRANQWFGWIVLGALIAGQAGKG